MTSFWDRIVSNFSLISTNSLLKMYIWIKIKPFVSINSNKVAIILRSKLQRGRQVPNIEFFFLSLPWIMIQNTYIRAFKLSQVKKYLDHFPYYMNTYKKETLNAVSFLLYKKEAKTSIMVVWMLYLSGSILFLGVYRWNCISALLPIKVSNHYSSVSEIPTLWCH